MLIEESIADYGLSNEFVVSTNELSNEALQVVARPNELLLRLRRVNEFGRQNGATFDSLITSGILMKLGRSTVRAAGLYLLVTTNHDEMEEEVTTATPTFNNMLECCEDCNAIYGTEDKFSEIAITLL